MKVFVTRHAVERLYQRFRVFLPRTVFSSHEATSFYIRDAVSKAAETSFAERMCVGKYNAKCVRLGHEYRTYQFQNKVFECAVIPEGIVVKTVYKRGK